MFRTQGTGNTDWSGRTLSALRARRWEERVAPLCEVRNGALLGLSPQELRSRIEGGWQAIPRKTARAQQQQEALRVLLEALPRQVDCLSIPEHSLLERLLIQCGCAELEELEELEAAWALRHRLWVDVGYLQGRVVARLDSRLAQPLREAMDRPAHNAVRMRLFSVHATLSGLLYIAGALDDGAPQRLFMEQVLQADPQDEEASHLARQYLWAAYDCLDYPQGVLLVHPALADPSHFVCGWSLPPEAPILDAAMLLGGMEGVLPVEKPLDAALTSLLKNALRPSEDVALCVQELRLLAKQGAPLEALHHVLAPNLCVLETPGIRHAVRALWQGVPRWEACSVPTTVHQAVQ
ncbi:MAG: hypothetical protein FWD25_01205 [Clostridia bacterium]|nr:hypothetical protein [Clostridia bacterium]